MVVSHLQVYKTVYNIIEGNIKFKQFIPSFYEEERVSFENLVNFLTQNSRINTTIKKR